MPYANSYIVALNVHRIVAKRTLLRIYKENSPASDATCNLLHQRAPSVVNPHNAAEQMHQWGVPNMAHNSINKVHALQLLVAFTTNDSLLTDTTTKDVQVVSGIVVLPSVMPRASNSSPYVTFSKYGPGFDRTVKSPKYRLSYIGR